MILLTRILLAALGGLPMLLLAITLALTWIDPTGPESVSWLRAAATLVLIEFLLLHSGAFMAVGPVLSDRIWVRLLWFLGFGLVYGFSLLTFAHWTGSDYILWVLVGVLLSRVMTLVILRDKRGTILMLQRSVIGMVILLLTALICFLPLPPLGITEELRYQAFGAADDFLRTHPQRTLAWGVVYFLLMAFVEVFAGWRTPDWTEQQVETTWTELRK
jgi:hypothetical protein